MKLKNKRTGNIMEIVIVDHGADWEIRDMYADEHTQTYNSLAELNEEWCDAPEEPKECWYINEFGTPTKADFVGRETLYDKCRKNFGNYFETKEEAEKTVERLRAWKRLKDKGFRFVKVDDVERVIHFEIPYRVGYDSCEAEADLDLLFGGEE